MIILIVFLVILILLLGFAIFAYLYVAGFFHSNTPKTIEQDGQKSKEYIINKSSTIGIGEINYMLRKIGAANLHNPPLSKDTPKIEVRIDERVFNTEVVDGKFYTNKGEIENEDIRIRSSNNEFVDIVLAKNLNQAIQDSVSSGRTRIEMVAGKLKLAAKGYLQIYEAVTGESLPV